MGVGISVLIALKAFCLLFVFVFLNLIGLGLLSPPFLYASTVSLLIAAASHPWINLPMLLGKGSDGSFPIWSIVIFSPYLYFVRVFSFMRRLLSGEAPYSEVYEGVYVGGWPSSPDKMPPGGPAIVDCTCEFPRLSEFSSHPYLCVPTWDTRAPRPEEIESAVKWACRKRAQNRPVFIHCAYGHGRSVAVTCALLVALGVAEDWKNAEKVIRERRPYIRLNALHRQALEEWSRHRISAPEFVIHKVHLGSNYMHQGFWLNKKFHSFVFNQLVKFPLLICVGEGEGQSVAATSLDTKSEERAVALLQ